MSAVLDALLLDDIVYAVCKYMSDPCQVHRLVLVCRTLLPRPLLALMSTVDTRTRRIFDALCDNVDAHKGTHRLQHLVLSHHAVWSFDPSYKDVKRWNLTSRHFALLQSARRLSISMWLWVHEIPPTVTLERVEHLTVMLPSSDMPLSRIQKISVERQQRHVGNGEDSGFGDLRAQVESLLSVSVTGRAITDVRQLYDVWRIQSFPCAQLNALRHFELHFGTGVCLPQASLPVFAVLCPKLERVSLPVLLGAMEVRLPSTTWIAFMEMGGVPTLGPRATTARVKSLLELRRLLHDTCGVDLNRVERNRYLMRTLLNRVARVSFSLEAASEFVQSFADDLVALGRSTLFPGIIEQAVWAQPQSLLSPRQLLEWHLISLARLADGIELGVLESHVNKVMKHTFRTYIPVETWRSVRFDGFACTTLMLGFAQSREYTPHTIETIYPFLCENASFWPGMIGYDVYDDERQHLFESFLRLTGHARWLDLPNIAHFVQMVACDVLLKCHTSNPIIREAIVEYDFIADLFIQPPRQIGCGSVPSVGNHLWRFCDACAATVTLKPRQLSPYCLECSALCFMDND